MSPLLYRGNKRHGPGENLITKPFQAWVPALQVGTYKDKICRSPAWLALQCTGWWYLAQSLAVHIYTCLWASCTLVWSTMHSVSDCWSAKWRPSTSEHLPAPVLQFLSTTQHIRPCTSANPTFDDGGLLDLEFFPDHIHYKTCRHIYMSTCFWH